MKITYGKEELKQLLIQELEDEFSKEGIDKLNIINIMVFIKFNIAK